MVREVLYTGDFRLIVFAVIMPIDALPRVASKYKDNNMNGDRKIWPDRTAVDLSLLMLRLVVGGIFMIHGSQKMFGAFGGPGLKAVVEMFGGGPLGYLVSIGEFFGGVGLVFGFLSRFSAASLIVIMA